jgi:tellurite resistance protein
MKLESPAEACAALAVLLAGADEVGTVEEGRFLFETVAAMPVFAGLDRSGFATLMGRTTEWVWSSFPTEGGRITDAGVSDLVARICNALPAEERLDTLKAAVGLARSDGVSAEEKQLLEALCGGLDIEPGRLAEFMDSRA